MDSVDAVVVGAGVVGLAVGRALALRGLETVVLERANAIGTGTSSRNSEVIHAGIYYPLGSLKARLCVAGRERLYAFCESHGVAHQRCGKLIVATHEAQRAKLAQIRVQALRNGVDDLRLLDAPQVLAMEPALSAFAALHSPSTGIVDSHVVTVGGDAPMELAARIVVNSAGLWAPALAAAIDGLARERVPRASYAKGNYFSLAGCVPFTHLIYPIPEAAGLGVHLTLDLAGQARFGPDVEWIAPATPDDIDYRVDPQRAEGFEAAIRAYWPGLPTGALQPAYSGVRPKLHSRGEAAQDFVLQGPAEHGIEGLMNLYGIESPGLTSSLALADEVIGRLGL